MMTWPKPVQKPHPPIILGGAFPHAARRAVRYGNGWVPIAGRGGYGQIENCLPPFKQMLAEAGRSLADVPITMFGVAPDADLVKRYRDHGRRPRRRRLPAGAGRQDLAAARQMGRHHPPGERLANAQVKVAVPAKAGTHSSASPNIERVGPGFRRDCGCGMERQMPDSDIRIIATGLGFPEGPVWMADGSVILGEISGKKVTRVAPDGAKTEIGKAGGGPNGVATGPDGALYVCNNGGAVYETTPSFLSTGPAPDYKNGSIQRIDPKTGETRTLYTECNGHKLSAPNDLVFDKQGGFYFTDLGKRYAHHRDHGGLYYALPDGSKHHRTRLSDAQPERGRPVAGRKDRLCRRHRKLAALRVRYRRARRCQARAFPGPVSADVCVCGLPGFQRFDSLAVEANGNICVATLITGHITVISPSGQVVRQVKMPDVYPTNICFGGTDLRTAYITLSASGQLAAMQWPEPGLKLNFMC